MLFSRIMIFGRPGSGKSTFAIRLHKLTGIPLYHLDKYFFTSGWRERDYQEFLKIQQELVEKESWIIDGNATRSLEMRYAQADFVLYFNYNPFVCFCRMIKRVFKKTHVDDRSEGCEEIIRWKLIKYMVYFNCRLTSKTRQLRELYPAPLFVEVRCDRQLEKQWKNLFYA